MNNCPVYRRVGGWAYGWVYPGPIGSILTPHLLGLKKAGKLPFASSLCGACGEVCPVKIDIPHQLVHLRHRAVNEPSPMNSWTERLTWAVWAWFMGGPLRYKLAMTGVRIGVRMAKFLALASRQAGRPGPAAASCPRCPAPISAAGGGSNRDDTSTSIDNDQPRHHIAACPRARFPRSAGGAAAGAARSGRAENPAPAAMAERFGKELADVQGEVIRCATMEEARRQLAELAARPSGPRRARWTARWSASRRPICRRAW